jgi:antitoxin VapB
VQTVSIPVDFRFPESVREVFIRREGESVILTPRPTDWSGFFASGLKASADFMAAAERLPVQERSF